MKTIEQTGGLEDRCPYCNNHHAGKTCPRVRVIEYNRDGSVKHVELFNTVTFPGLHKRDE